MQVFFYLLNKRDATYIQIKKKEKKISFRYLQSNIFKLQQKLYSDFFKKMMLSKSSRKIFVGKTSCALKGRSKDLFHYDLPISFYVKNNFSLFIKRKQQLILQFFLLSSTLGSRDLRIQKFYRRNFINRFMDFAKTIFIWSLVELSYFCSNNFPKFQTSQIFKIKIQTFFCWFLEIFANFILGFLNLEVYLRMIPPLEFSLRNFILGFYPKRIFSKDFYEFYRRRIFYKDFYL